MSRPAAAEREEHLIVASPGRDIAVTAGTVVLTAAIFAAVPNGYEIEFHVGILLHHFQPTAAL